MSNRILPGIVSRDVIYGGDGRIYGTTKIGASPASRRVRLFDGKTAQLVREQVSAADGSYEFSNLERTTTRRYFAVGHDHTDTYNAVIADRIAPEKMAAQTPSGAIIDAFNSGAAAGVSPSSFAAYDVIADHFEIGGAIGSTGDPYWALTPLYYRWYMSGLGTAFSGTGYNANPIINIWTTSAQGGDPGGTSYYSIVMNGNAAGYLYFNDYSFAAKEFCLEMWVKYTGTAGGAQRILAGKTTATSSGLEWMLFKEATTDKMAFSYSTNGTAWAGTISSDSAISANVWYHVAVVRRSGTFYMYINGVQQVSTAAIGTTSIFVSSSSIALGTRTGDSTGNWIGNVSHFRFTVGHPRYSGNFTTTTEILPVTGRGITLFKNTTGGTAIATGDLSVSSSEKKFGATSLYLPASASGITIGSGLSIGAKPFSVDAWVNIADNTKTIFIFESDGGTTNGISLSVVSGYVRFAIGATQPGLTYLFSQSALAPNTWNHVALCRVGTVFRVFVNGVLEIAIDKGITHDQSSARIGNIANISFAGYTAAYLDDYRITINASRFPGVTFDDGNDDPHWGKVALRMTMGGINSVGWVTDLTGKAVTVAGNAQISTAQSKFGGSSLWLDGAGDYLTIPDSADFAFGAGNFTIECWFKQAATVGPYTLVSQRTSSTSNFAFVFYISGSTVGFTCSTNGIGQTHNATKSYTQETTSWHHAAIVRNGANLTVYVDGVGGTPVSIGTNAIFDSTAVLVIGGDVLGTQNQFNGYLDDLRITNGVARYTADFTPPTAPHPVPNFAVPTSAFPDA